MHQHDRDSRHPEFEFVDPSGGAIHYLEHGYPHPLVRWHFHNEYELHYIVASSGKVFVGDYIGEFKPGNLILTGPRLPHNWISIPEGSKQLALRDMVVQFEHATIERAAGPTCAPEPFRRHSYDAFRMARERNRYRRSG